MPSEDSVRDTKVIRQFEKLSDDATPRNLQFVIIDPERRRRSYEGMNQGTFNSFENYMNRNGYLFSNFTYNQGE